MFGMGSSIDGQDMEVNLHMMDIDLHMENIWEKSIHPGNGAKIKTFLKEFDFHKINVCQLRDLTETQIF
jgi:hypothetical protein